MTRQVALIGKPLKRRHSQVMHDAAFDACGIDVSSDEDIRLVWRNHHVTKG